MALVRSFLGIVALSMLGCKTAEVVVPPPPPPPPSYGLTSPALNELLSESYADTRAVDVYYATNRAMDRSTGGCDDDAYGVDPGDGLHFGRCRLNVPKRHAVGELPEAENPRADPHRFFRVLGHQTLAADQFSAALSDSTEPDLLVLVHGFNVKFGEAVLRAAQIAYDLKFQGPVVLYSWPAGARGGFSLINRTYSRNRENAKASIVPAADVFEMLSLLPKRTHALVHSMGHQVVIPALDSVAARVDRPFLGEVVLNAPDIPIEAFAAAVPSILSKSRRVTVYCSYNDNAIAASEAVNDGRRLGACERVEGVDVINVGEIDAPAMGVAGLGHGYYASRPILTDVFQTLMGIEASRRLFIRLSEPNSTEGYYLRR